MTDQKELATIGRNALSAIREMVAALECDYERLEELRDEISALELERDELAEMCEAKEAATEEEFDERSDKFRDIVKDLEEHREELKYLEEAAGECKDREDAETRIHEDPLEIQVRGDWHSLGDDDEGPCEFYILLATGGPAVRIMGELQDGEPHRAYLQTQDWGTPWTDYYEEGAAEVLMSYCRCFCFGE